MLLCCCAGNGELNPKSDTELDALPLHSLEQQLTRSFSSVYTIEAACCKSTPEAAYSMLAVE